MFLKKTSNVIPALKPEISIQKGNIIKKKSSRTIFSESDSDEEFLKTKSTTIEKVPYNISNNDSTNILDSSSEDDLFNIQSYNKLILKPESALISSPVHKVLSETNPIKNEIKSKTSIKNENIKDTRILNERIIDELKKNSEELNGKTNNIVNKNESLSNDIIEFSQSTNKTMIQSNKKSLDFQHSKKLNNLFSSDEDDLDDNTYFNVSNSNTNYIKTNKIISNMDKVEYHTSDELKSDTKVEIFDSSSDDDIFNTDKLKKNLISTKNIKEPIIQEIKNIELKSNDNCAIIDQEKSTVVIDKKNTTGNRNIFSSLSDDEDDDYLSINSVSDTSMNTTSIETINKNIQITSSSSKEFLNVQIDTKNDDIFQNLSSENLLNKNQNSVKVIDINMPKNETLGSSCKENIIKSIFSNVPNENSKIESKTVNPTSNKNTSSKKLLKDFVDGSSFSSPNTKTETPIKLPGIDNFFIII